VWTWVDPKGSTLPGFRYDATVDEGFEIGNVFAVVATHFDNHARRTLFNLRAPADAISAQKCRTHGLSAEKRLLVGADELAPLPETLRHFVRVRTPIGNRYRFVRLQSMSARHEREQAAERRSPALADRIRRAWPNGTHHFFRQ
jgi:hypothetical protein